MTCYHPLEAFQLDSGEIKFTDFWGGDPLTLPCGRCIGCRLERSRQWAVRCVHEAKMYEFNCFITLTYSPENLPLYGSLRYSDFQLFMKRLRKKFSDFKVRFYMCGEYGENFNRPHYHACIFGIDFPDKKLFSRSASSPVFTSSILDSLWPHGYASLGEVNFESAAYVARYVMKKITGDAAQAHYERVVIETGEVVSLVPEFTKMSLKPGIGSPWLDKYMSDVFPHDRVVLRGAKSKPPRYYFKKFEKLFPLAAEDISFKRFLDNRVRLHDNTPERLATRELVTNARLNLFKRDTF